MHGFPIGSAAWKVRRRLDPIPGESLDGFIARAAAHNDCDNALAISAQGGVAYGHRPVLTTHGWDGLMAVAHCLDVDIGELQLRSYPLADLTRDLRTFFGTPIERRHLETRTRRFSPGSLTRSAHHRALWQLRLFPFCVETWEYLIDRCPRCQAVQRWYRTNGVERCDFCVEDLRRAPASLVPPQHREAARAAIGLIHPDPNRRLASLELLPTEIRSLGAGAALDLLVRMLSLVDRSMPGAAAGKRRAWSASPPQITAALAKAWPLLAAWPDAVLNLITANIAAAPSRYSDGAHGMSIQFLNSASLLPHPDIDKAIAHLRAQVDLDGPQGDAIRSRTLDLKSLSRLLGHNTQQLAQIRRRGGLPTVFTLEGGRAVARYDAAEMAEIRRWFEQRLSFERAAWLLGISYHGVEQLAAMGLIPTITHRYFTLRYGGPQTTLPGLQEFQRVLEGGARDAVPHPIRLRSAVAVIGGRLKPWGPILRGLLAGAIPYRLSEAAGRLSHRIEIGRASLPDLAQLHFRREEHLNIPFANAMTRHDAGEALNLQPKEYTPLLKLYENADPSCDRVVPVSKVEDLAKALIGSAEVALRLGINPRSAFTLLQKIGGDMVHPFLWYRARVEPLLFDTEEAAATRRLYSPGPIS